MLQNTHLFMVLIGCRPIGRHTEQHDVFFGCANSLKELLPEINLFWPEAKGNFHIDAWQAITYVDGFSIKVYEQVNAPKNTCAEQLFFINLGGYKPNEFEEFHYKMVVAAVDKGVAVRNAKQTAFYKHTGFKGATAHIDDKYGIDADDIHQLTDILSPKTKEKYKIVLEKTENGEATEMQLGYLPIRKIV